MENWKKWILRTLSYVLVAAVASVATLVVSPRLTKLELLATVIRNRFVEETDMTRLRDAAATGMVASLGDRWSYYIPEDQYQAYDNNQSNRYVGVGITVMKREDGTGFEVQSVTSGGPAEKAGLLAGDIITHADGTELGPLDMTAMRSLIMGEKNTKVVLTVLRAGESMDFTVTRKSIHSVATTGQMLPDQIGLVTISNFHDDAGKETVKVIEDLVDQGAAALILDVRDNPGGYTRELVEVLDYLLPEGPLFRSVTDGKEEVDMSDAKCLELPMAVLMNGNSYSSAEFFAAALSEYDWAVTVGEPTTGKARFQITFTLGDGSAVNLSVGRYLTPNGVDLTESGGLVPDISVEPAETAVMPEDDPQIQAAAAALKASGT